MPRIKMTKSAIAKLRAPHPSGKQTMYWDEAFPGFGVKVSGTTSKKSYIVQRALPGKRSRQKVIGPVDDRVMDLKEAYRQAGIVLADMYAGVDPRMKAKEVEVATYTLGQAVEDFVTAQLDRKMMKEKTANEYRWNVKYHMGDWEKKALVEITINDVLKRHDKIMKDVANRSRSRLATGTNSANAAIRVLRAVWNDAKLRFPTLPNNPAMLPKNKWFKTEARDVRLVYEEDEAGNVVRNDFKKFYAAITDPNIIPSEVQRKFLEFVLSLLITPSL